MKYIIVVTICLFCFISGYSQNTTVKGKLFIKDVSNFSIKKSQLNDSLELAIDLKIDAMTQVAVYWNDSTINKVRMATLFTGLIPKWILSEWKKIPSNGKIIFDEPKCFDKNKNESVSLETFTYEVIN
jgi:hypothetical protein